MGKRIRHLEYYGYADQNVYIGLPNVDLEDIRETNKEQDKEIMDISGATKEKADVELVNALSGKVDTFISAQTTINETLVNAVNTNSTNIEALQQRDVEITDMINELADDFDPIYDRLDEVDEKIDELSSKVDEYADFKEEATNKFNEIESELDEKLNKTEAEETYAKKSDVYTKREVDELLEESAEGAATREWVLNRGYITEVDADAKYASKASVTALSDRVNDVQTDLYRQYNSLNNDYTAFKVNTNARLDTFNTRLGTLETKHDREVANLNDRIDNVQAQVTDNKDEIRRINEISLPNKVDKSDFDSLENDVESLSALLDDKVDKTIYNADKTNIVNAINNLDANKADKSEITEVNNSISDLNDALQDEINNRINGDNALDGKIDTTNVRIDNIERENVERDENIAELESGLAEEIQNRINGDLNIIGQPTDRDVALTIYGTRKYADKVAANAVDEANVYTDNKDSELRIFINDEVVEPLEREISGKADKTYVDNVKSDILNTIDSKIDVETQRAKNEELRLESNLASETARAIAQERQLISATTHIGNKVAALTDWDGDDRIDYTDEGNGIIDVMHRELHDVNEDLGTFFANVSYNSSTNKIVFENKNGEEVGELDVSEFVPTNLEARITAMENLLAQIAERLNI